MSSRSMTLLVSAVAALSFGALGCKSTGPKQMEAEEAVVTPLGTGTEFQEAEVETNRRTQSAAMLDLDPIYFDYDRFDIRDDAKPVLRSNAETIKASDTTAALTIEGHCDDRGSAEYNLALGERRANVVKRYLVNLGVPESRLTTVSFGEARPAVRGQGEYVWSMNRRSEIRADGTAKLEQVSSK